MSQTIAILTGDEKAPTGLCPAFASPTAEVVCIPCNEFLPVALQAASPSFALIAGGFTWGAPASLRGMLESMGITTLGPTAAAVRKMSNLADAYAHIASASERGEIDVCLPGHLYLDADVVDSLVRCGKLDIVESRFDGTYPLAVLDANEPASQTPVLVANADELATVMNDFAKSSRCMVVEEPRSGVEVIVPILGDLDDILILPPVEMDAATGETHIPVRLSSLSDDEADAQGIRSEIERCALDAFIVCNCREAATVHLVWDGGKVRFVGIDMQPSLLEGGAIVSSLDKAGISLREVAVELSDIVFERS